MPGFLAQLGMQAAGQATGAGMGLLLQRGQDRRQLNMQRKLQRMEMEGSKEMTDYNFRKQLEMWEATNYKAQMAQLKQAGLNPGLIYGMGGTGGATTNVDTATTSTAQAPKGGGEALAMGITSGQNILQMQLLEAQKRNIDADTANKQAQATKTAGVDTQKTTAEIQAIHQGIEQSIANIAKLKQETNNLKAQEQLTKLESGLKDLQTQYEQATLQDRKKLMQTSLQQATETLRIIITNADINDATKRNQIQQVEADLFMTYAQTRLLTASKNLTVQQLETEKAKLEQIAAQIVQGRKRLDIDKMNAETNRSYYYDSANQNDDPIGDLLDKVGFLIPIPGKAGHKPIEGFRRKN